MQREAQRSRHVVPRGVGRDVGGDLVGWGVTTLKTDPVGKLGFTYLVENPNKFQAFQVSSQYHRAIDF